MQLSKCHFLVAALAGLLMFQQAAIAEDYSTVLYEWESKTPSADIKQQLWKLNQGMTPFAENGDPAAQFYLARSRGHDLSPLFDQAQSLNWHLKAAEGGYVFAMLEYAEMISADPTQQQIARSWLERAAKISPDEAAFLLRAERIMNKSLFNRYEASRLLDDAATKGDVSAMEVLCLSSSNISRFSRRPLSTCERAAAIGSVPSMLHLGMLYEARMDDFFVSPSRKETALFALRDEAKNFKPDQMKARHWYANAAQAGNAKAMARFARFLVQGLGGKADMENALTWAQNAAAQNEPEGLAVMGLIFSNERLGHKDGQRGVDMLLRAAQQGNAPAMLNLVVMYAHGQDVARDFQKALAWAYLLQEEFNLLVAMEGYEGLVLLDVSQVWGDLIAQLPPEAALQGRRAAQGLREDLARKGFWPFRTRRETYALTY
ncbi:exported hypothetical protein [Rhodospirillaceae bacterium LM-1]|nr:exported hypothetical protein [Rhodospirillaceae bacterium LM-1]